MNTGGEEKRCWRRLQGESRQLVHPLYFEYILRWSGRDSPPCALARIEVCTQRFAHFHWKGCALFHRRMTLLGEGRAWCLCEGLLLVGHGWGWGSGVPVGGFV